MEVVVVVVVVDVDVDVYVGRWAELLVQQKVYLF